ncbi:MAG: carbonic anhydrase family protein [Proteobacteria bacterium]|nr:carbonic anhydrase family protein [Pseudomonadota bacterium]
MIRILLVVMAATLVGCLEVKNNANDYTEAQFPDDTTEISVSNTASNTNNALAGPGAAAGGGATGMGGEGGMMATPHWGYSGHEGPQHWGDLSPAFEQCKLGMEQSPIDIQASAATPTDLPNIHFNYQPFPLEIVNNGHTIVINVEEGSHIEVGGSVYELIQFHFHALSEHTIDGQHSPMEVHFVHANARGSLAVVGAMMEVGPTEHPDYAAIWAHLPQQKGMPHQVASVMVDATDLMPMSQQSYRYAGSLTTPPCSEGVAWHVLTDPVMLSQAQIDAFTAIYDHNYRPVGDLHGRQVLLDSTP